MAGGHLGLMGLRTLGGALKLPRFCNCDNIAIPSGRLNIERVNIEIDAWWERSK